MSRHSPSHVEERVSPVTFAIGVLVGVVAALLFGLTAGLMGRQVLGPRVYTSVLSGHNSDPELGRWVAAIAGAAVVVVGWTLAALCFRKRSRLGLGLGLALGAIVACIMTVASLS